MSGFINLKNEQRTHLNINQGCVVASGMRTGHFDPSRWDEADKFQPERFLDEKGKLDLKKDHSLPFGAGKKHFSI